MQESPTEDLAVLNNPGHTQPEGSGGSAQRCVPHRAADGDHVGRFGPDATVERDGVTVTPDGPGSSDPEREAPPCRNLEPDMRPGNVSPCHPRPLLGGSIPVPTDRRCCVEAVGAGLS